MLFLGWLKASVTNQYLVQLKQYIAGIRPRAFDNAIRERGAEDMIVAHRSQRNH